MQWIKSVLAFLWFRAIGQMPVPSESKWRGLNQLLALVCESSLHVDGDLAAPYEPTVDHAMFYAGTKWMRTRAEWLQDSIAPTPAMTDLLLLAFKTLDMTTRVRREDDTIIATTFRCPLVEQATTMKTARRICQVTCSDGRSLFHGMVKGIPLAVAYRAPRKMGWGHPVCIKHFQLTVAAGAKRGAPSAVGSTKG